MTRRAAPLLAVVAVAVLSALPAFLEPVRWTPDGFFYHARVLMLHGLGEDEAVREVLSGPLVAEARSYTDHTQLARLENGAWVEHTTSITRRRLFVPLLAAAVYPLAGDASIRAVSIAGYVAFVAVLFVLLRRRFGVGTSVAVSLGVALLAPLREWSFLPLTDSWGLALQTGALLGAVQVLDRGARWLPAWALPLLALSFTRDSAAIVVAAAGWLALRERTRETLALVVTGLVAAAPAPLLFGAPVSNTVARNVGDLGAYVAGVESTLRLDVVGDFTPAQAWPALALAVALAAAAFAWRAPQVASIGLRAAGAYLALTLAATAVLATRSVEPIHAVPTGIVLVGGIVLLLVPGARDPYVTLIRAAAVASVGYVLIWPVPSGLRLLLPLLPMAAVGLTRVLELRHRATLVATAAPASDDAARGAASAAALRA